MKYVKADGANALGSYLIRGAAMASDYELPAEWVGWTGLVDPDLVSISPDALEFIRDFFDQHGRSSDVLDIQLCSEISEKKPNGDRIVLFENVIWPGIGKKKDSDEPYARMFGNMPVVFRLLSRPGETGRFEIWMGDGRLQFRRIDLE